MVNKWHELTANVLMETGKENKPVATEATVKQHPEWTNFDAPLTRGKSKTRPQGPAVDSGAPATALPRGRVGTKLSVEGRQLVLSCTGHDPGLAFDGLGLKSPGPYTLAFRIQSHASGSGALFWTTDPKTPLPKGRSQAFPITHDGQWHDVALIIDEPDTLFAMRLDPCSGAGEVRIESLRLKDPNGHTLKTWP